MNYQESTPPEASEPAAHCSCAAFGDPAAHGAPGSGRRADACPTRWRQFAELFDCSGRTAAGVAHEVANALAVSMPNLTHSGEYAIDIARTMRSTLVLLNEAQDLDEARRGVAALAARIDLDFMLTDLDCALDDCRDGLRRIASVAAHCRTLAQFDGHRGWHALDVNSLLSSAMALMRHGFDSSTTINQSLGTLPSVICRPTRLGTALRGLLRCALATADGGSVSVATCTRDGYACIDITVFPRRAASVDPNLHRPAVCLACTVTQEHGGVFGIERETGGVTIFRVALPGAGCAENESRR